MIEEKFAKGALCDDIHAQFIIEIILASKTLSLLIDVEVSKFWFEISKRLLTFWGCRQSLVFWYFILNLICGTALKTHVKELADVIEELQALSKSMKGSRKEFLLYSRHADVFFLKHSSKKEGSELIKANSSKALVQKEPCWCNWIV